jgi:hypothetical protein
MEHASAGVASGGAGMDARARPAAGGDGDARARMTSRVRRSGLNCVAGALFQPVFLQKIE